jgi:hypothetical protein
MVERSGCLSVVLDSIDTAGGSLQSLGDIMSGPTMGLVFLAVLPIYLMFAHYVGDFLLQTAWMANGKSKSILPLTVHISVYTLTLILFGLPLYFIGFLSGFWSWYVAFCILNGLLHFATDFITSKISSKAYAEGNIRKFWAVIGFDQFIHMATFWVVFLILILVMA